MNSWTSSYTEGTPILSFSCIVPPTAFQPLQYKPCPLRLKKVNSKVGVGGGRVAGPEVIVDRHREEEDSGFRTQPGR